MVVPESEFPRVLDVLAKTRATITPTAEELVAIAKRIDVDEVLSLEASVTVVRSKRSGNIELDGNVTASVRQSCVSTGAPVLSDIVEPFVVPIVVGDSDDLDDDIGDDDDDEVVRTSDGKVDVGEIAIQYLCLEIDPYPRSVPVNPSEPIAQHGDRDDTQPEAFFEVG